MAEKDRNTLEAEPGMFYTFKKKKEKAKQYSSGLCFFSFLPDERISANARPEFEQWITTYEPSLRPGRQ